MHRLPQAHQKVLSVGLAIAMVAWWPLCCCLTSEAKASAEPGGPAMQAVESHGPGCHGHSQSAPAEDGQPPNPGPCECPQLVIEHLATAPDLLMSADRGRELIDLSLLPVSDLATILPLVDPDHPPSWLAGDGEFPRQQSAPSLLMLRTSLTL